MWFMLVAAILVLVYSLLDRYNVKKGGNKLEHINTLKFFEELKAGGVPEEQARTQTYALNSALDHVATKEDLTSVKEDLNGVKADVKELKADVKEIKGDIRKFMWGGLLALAGGTVKVLFFH